MLNRVLFLGFMARDPELRYTPNGTAVCGFAVASNRRWKDQAGEQKEEVTFVEFTAWGKTGETINQYFKKGKAILVEGRLQVQKWEDKQTGQQRSKMIVVVESFSFVNGGKEVEPSSPGSKVDPADVPKVHQRGKDPDYVEPVDEDGIPF